MKKISKKSKKKIKEFFLGIWEDVVLLIILLILLVAAIIPKFLIFQAIADGNVPWWIFFPF